MVGWETLLTRWQTSAAGSSTRTRATRFPSADPARRATRGWAASTASLSPYRARSATGAGASPWAACVRISESRSDEKHCFLPRRRQERPQLPRAAGPPHVRDEGVDRGDVRGDVEPALVVEGAAVHQSTQCHSLQLAKTHRLAQLASVGGVPQCNQSHTFP